MCGSVAADCLLIRLHGVVVWKYEPVFNTKYFIINTEITILCNRNRSVVLTCIYMQTRTQVVVYWRREMADTYTHPYPPLISCAQTHIHLGARILLALLGLLPIHTQTSSYLMEICLMTDTHTHTHTLA